LTTSRSLLNIKVIGHGHPRAVLSLEQGLTCLFVKYDGNSNVSV